MAVEPRYMNENRYTYVCGTGPAVASSIYFTSTPESSYERRLHALILEGQKHLQHEEYVLALAKLREAQTWVLTLLEPHMPVDPNAIEWFDFPFDPRLVDSILDKTEQIILRTSPPSYTFPETLVNDEAPDYLARLLQPITGTGIGTSGTKKTLVVRGKTQTLTVELDPTGGPAPGMRAFVQALAVANDVSVLTNWTNPVQMLAYVPHLYFFILPMSIGDCHAGLGDYERAARAYAGTLVYQGLNALYEVPKLWQRLAQTYLDRGDEAYRNAKDDVAAYAAAKAFYEAIVRADRSLDPASPLYQPTPFNILRNRIEAALASGDPVFADENPAILAIVLDALTKLKQIEAGLNFFGFAPSYAPPFSFEYLQNTARYFAQHASQVEQRYIQYKSQAEGEELRREQIAQQADVARETVVLENAGVTEAQRGRDVAQASLAYADAQQASAVAARDEFNARRPELLALTTIEAWANASAVDKGDQVKLTIRGSNFFAAESVPRNVVLKDLALKKTVISHDLEAARLSRAISSANASINVARAQVAQASARVAAAEQRVAVARLQQRQAEENRDFLDMREFGARLWYEIARQARKIQQRYLDMATAAAFLMERAYNAETERGLNVVRYNYRRTPAGNLMGADLLLSDIDLFTADHITTTRSKKAPVKTTVSLADQYPSQLQRLRTTGQCTFETTFAEFDRRHAGLYLAKIRNVEVVFVGVAGVGAIAGTLRNVGISRFRRADGTTFDRLYPADVMILSDYEIRKDALVFRFNPNELRLFENNGIETLWQLDLPLDANDFDFSGILDVHVALYYDGFFDGVLEKNIRASLPKTGAITRVDSLKLIAPDELFYLKNKGEAELTFETAMFPANQKNLVRTTHTIKVTGKPETAKGLTLRLTTGAGELVLKTNDSGEILDEPASAPLRALRGKPVLDGWKIVIRAADNPHLPDFLGIDDVLVYYEYKFDYR